VADDDEHIPIQKKLLLELSTVLFYCLLAVIFISKSLAQFVTQITVFSAVTPSVTISAFVECRLSATHPQTKSYGLDCECTIAIYYYYFVQKRMNMTITK